ncbi:MAG: hypothetical protein LUQ16_00830 [Methanomassiliicoccales archaeon]|jgi:hypothetical protein|nr:hypothetical protein [Methanomassiliicoccales archaeon]MDD1755605.1 hypothetical protein [Methanomassiliicoccales archaeon]
MAERKRRAKLGIIATAFVLWLMLASIMGASASYFDSEQAIVSLTGFTSSRWTQTTRADFQLDVRANVDIDRQPDDVILSGRTEFLYAFRGGNSRSFWRYNTSTTTWGTLANAPALLRDEGGALASDGDRYIYAIHGGNRQFWRYDTSYNLWSTMAPTPNNVRLGGGLSYDGKGGFYALRGDSNNGFWRYNVATDAWAVLINTPGTVSDGGCLVSDQKNFVFAIQGNGLSAFWRYNVTSNSWSTMAPVPYQVRYGGAMTYDGIDSIYALTGWSQPYFLRYSISENHWYTLSNIPSAVSYGGSLAFCYPSTLFAFSGGGTSRYWQYAISTGTWSAAISAPGTVGVGGALTNGPLMFSRAGTLTSVTCDTGKAGSSILGLFWSEALASGTDITFEMRASDTLSSGAPSGPWIGLGGTSPVISGLPSGRYIQWRATLTTSNLHLTPVLQEVRIYYV